MNIKEEIHALSEEMIANIGRLVAIDSQLGTPEEGRPFGQGPAMVLDEALKIADELGFKTVNLDNYCGYAEIGEGRGNHRHCRTSGYCAGRRRLDIMTHFHLPEKGTMYMAVEPQMIRGLLLEALYAMKLLRDSGVKLEQKNPSDHGLQ